MGYVGSMLTRKCESVSNTLLYSVYNARATRREMFMSELVWFLGRTRARELCHVGCSCADVPRTEMLNPFDDATQQREHFFCLYLAHGVSNNVGAISFWIHIQPTWYKL